VRGHYLIVLALILLTLVFQLAAPESEWARYVAICLQGATLIAALYASGVHRWLQRLANAVVAVALVGSGVAALAPGDMGPAAARIITLLLIVLVPAAIATGVTRQVRAEGTVTVRTMFGVLCIYLLIGSTFAFAFGLIGDLASQPFFVAYPTASPADYLYFSFATLTTVGYGDFTAALEVGRSLAIAEALIGQIYLVTVVAVIVGALGRQGADRERGPA
jgi:hypothetical protein